MPRQFDAVDQEHGHRDVLGADSVQEGALQGLSLVAHVFSPVVKGASPTGMLTTHYILFYTVSIKQLKLVKSLFLLPLRVKLLVLVTEELVGDVRIYLSRRNGRVSEHHLYRAKVRPVIKKVCCK